MTTSRGPRSVALAPTPLTDKPLSHPPDVRLPDVPTHIPQRVGSGVGSSHHLTEGHRYLFVSPPTPSRLRGGTLHVDSPAYDPEKPYLPRRLRPHVLTPRTLLSPVRELLRGTWAKIFKDLILKTKSLKRTSISQRPGTRRLRRTGLKMVTSTVSDASHSHRTDGVVLDGRTPSLVESEEKDTNVTSTQSMSVVQIPHFRCTRGRRVPELRLPVGTVRRSSTERSTSERFCYSPPRPPKYLLYYKVPTRPERSLLSPSPSSV